jgi:hypothetical protein
MSNLVELTIYIDFIKLEIYYSNINYKYLQDEHWSFSRIRLPDIR